MDTYERYYDRSTRAMLSFAGLSIYRITILTNIRRMVSILVLLIFIYVQLNACFAPPFSIRRYIATFATIFPSTLYLIGYCTYIITTKKVKIVFERIQYDWSVLTDKKELEIITRYSSIRKLFSLFVFSSLVALGLFALILITPLILDVYLPLEEPRPREAYISMKYFMNQHKYFWLIALHIIWSTIIGLASIFACQSLFMICIQHSCAMLKITRYLYVPCYYSYHIEHAIDKYVCEEPMSGGKAIMSAEICYGIRIHNRAIEFIEYVESILSFPYFVANIIVTASLAVNMFNLHQAIVNTYGTGNIMLSLFLVIWHFLCIFVFNYTGQLLTDHGSDVFDSVYGTGWYAIPPSVQRILLFIMLRSTKECAFNAGGLITFSVKRFSTIVSTSVSYFTVMHSSM